MVSVNDAMEHANVSTEYLKKKTLSSTSVFLKISNEDLLSYKESRIILTLIRPGALATSTSGKELKIEEKSAHEDR